MLSIDSRVSALERNEGVMQEQISKLTEATKDNTGAVRDLTTTLSYNKGLVVASARFASVMTVVIGAAWAAGTWVVSLFHAGTK